MADIAQLAIKVDSKELVTAKRNLDNLDPSARKAESATASLTSAYARLGGVMGGAAVLGVFTKIIRATSEQEAAVAQLNATLASTGQVAGRTSQDLQKMASQLQKITTFGDEAIIKMQSLLLTFTNVRGESFDNAAMAVLNLASKMGGDLTSAAMQVGKALNDPILGVTSLSRAGVQFSDSQKEVIKQMVETNRMADAQKIILKELEVQFGGSAEAARNTLGGALKALSNAFGDLFEVNSEKATVFTGIINQLTSAVEFLGGSADKTKTSLDRLLPALRKYNEFLGLDKTFKFPSQDSFDLSGTGFESGITKVGMGLAELTELAEKFKAANPFADEQSQIEAYNKKLDDLNILLRAGLITQKEYDRYKNQFAQTIKKSTQEVEKYNVTLAKNIKELKDINNLVRSGMDIDEARTRVTEKAKGASEDKINLLIQEQNIQKELLQLEKDKLEAIKESEEAQRRVMEYLQRQANENFTRAQDQEKRLTEMRMRNFEMLGDNLQRSITDSIIRGFENGQKFIDVFKRAIINSSRGFAISIGVDFVGGALRGATAGLGGTLLDAIGLGDGQSRGFGSIFSGISDSLFRTNASIIGGIEGIGATIANGMGGIRDTIGGFVGANSALIANIATFADAGLKLLQGDIKGAAFSGAGAAIGLAFGGPVGGAIGSFLGSTVGGLFGGKKQPPRTVTELPQLAEAFSGQLGALLGGFGLGNDVSANAKFSGRAGGSGYGDLSAMVNGVEIRDIIRYKDAYSEASMQEFITRTLTTTLIGAIQSSKLSNAIKELFSDLSEQEEVSLLISDVIKLNSASKELNQSLNISVDEVALMARESKVLGEGFSNLVSILVSTATETLTIGDAILSLKSNITETIGISLPDSLKAYDEALRAVNTSTVEGREEFLKIIGARGAFAEFDNLIIGLQNNIRNGLFAIVDDSEKLAMQQSELSKVFAELNLQVPNNVNELIELGKSIDLTTKEGINLASVFPQLVAGFQATQDSIQKLQLAQIAVAREAVSKAESDLQFANTLVDQATQTLRDSFAAERSRLQAVIDNVKNFENDLRNAFNVESSEIQKTIDTFNAFGNSIRNFRQTLTSTALSAEAFFNQTFALALQGNAQAINDLQRASTEYLNSVQRAVDSFNVTNLENLLRNAFSVEASEIQKTIDTFDLFKNSISEFRKTLINSVDAQKDLANSSEIFFNETVARALRGDANALNDLQRASTEYLNSVESALNNIDVDNLKNNLKQAFNIEETNIQKTIDKFKLFGNSISSFRKSLGQIVSAESDPLSSSRNLFNETIASALRGDADALGNIERVSTNYLNTLRDYSTDFLSYQRAFNEVSKTLLEVENSTFASADVAELQLLELRTQVEAFIDLNDNVVTVEQAIQELISGQTAQIKAEQQYQKVFNLINAKLTEVENSSQSSLTLAQLQLAELTSTVESLIQLDVGILSVEEAIQNLINGRIEQSKAEQEAQRVFDLINNSLLQVEQSTFATAKNAEIELQELKNQVSLLINIDQSVISVEQAIINLEQAQKAAQSAQIELNYLNKKEVDLLGDINNSILSLGDALRLYTDSILVKDIAEKDLASAKMNLSLKETPLSPSDLYTTFLGREADAEGLAYWKNEFGDTVDINELRTFQNAVIETLNNIGLDAYQAMFGSDATRQTQEFASLQFAKGGAFTNSIIKRPTQFNTGLMGEAGAEAIMPLANVGGRLGVTTNNSEMVAQLKEISEKMTKLEAANVSTAQNTAKFAKIIDRADNGDSLNVTLVTE